MLRCQYAQQRRLEKAVISLFPVRSEIIGLSRYVFNSSLIAYRAKRFSGMQRKKPDC